MIKNYYKDITNKINSLTIYKNLKQDKVIEIISSFSQEEDLEEKLSSLACLLINYGEREGVDGNLIEKYIIDKILEDENMFSIFCENNKNIENTSLYALALNDIECLKKVMYIKLEDFHSVNFAISTLSEYKCVNKKKSNKNFSKDNLLEEIIAYYKKYGCGNMGSGFMLKVDSGLNIVPVNNPDSITFEDLIGYENQFKTLRENTEAFLEGYACNNILLAGARGTGKSSSVKALGNEYANRGLRIVEITKEQILNLHTVLNKLKNRGKKFIIFIDDLTFDENDTSYKYMKSLLEGSGEVKPDNVLFYATSNRRHLVRENWSDRDKNDEIFTTDNMNEKLSLSDRFGITLSFTKPTPQQYLDIVLALAKKEGIQIPQDEIIFLAKRWELNQKGLSGRTARQFINNLKWEVNKK